jgi:PPP family 3-phenylpropionic acid transporter
LALAPLSRAGSQWLRAARLGALAVAGDARLELWRRHVGAMRLLHRDAPEQSAAMAQTLYAVMSGGLLMGASTLMSGRLYDVGGAIGYWAMAAMAGAGGLIALFLIPPKPRVSTATPQ